MKRYNVTICWEVWKYYEVEVEANSVEEAEDKLDQMIEEDPGCVGEVTNTDGNGYTVVETEEVTP